MSDTKIKVEIKLDTWTKIKKQYENSRDTYEKMGMFSVDDFISYIIDNFTDSSKQFDKLSEKMKSLMEDIDIDNLNFEDLFKNIAESSPKKNNDKNNNNNNENSNKKS